MAWKSAFAFCDQEPCVVCKVLIKKSFFPCKKVSLAFDQSNICCVFCDFMLLLEMLTHNQIAASK